MREMKLSFLIFVFIGYFPFSKTAKAVEVEKSPASPASPASCAEWLSRFPGDFNKEDLQQVCAKSVQLPTCESQVGHHPIYHYDQTGLPQGKRILVFSLFHGDEYPAGSMARDWMLRLNNLKNGRNNWRIIPIVNPDGVLAKTRVNARGVDLNRNLPTENWKIEAAHRWEKIEKKDKRRFPGGNEASESEVNCVMKQIEDFKPDFIVSIHTPYGVLDFDGPEKQKNPPIKDLPWKRLGNYPGSLGRFMWAEKSIPVLTVELKGNLFNQTVAYVNKLQDVIGTVAITSDSFGPQEKAILQKALVGNETITSKKLK
jgi:hypothetical protein